MGGRVGGVHELSGNEAVRDLLGQLVGLGDGALHALGPFGQNQLRAIGLHDLAALHAHGLRHDDDDAVPPGGGHGGQPNSRVAGGGLNDDGAGLQKALGLGVVDHGLGDPVLDRPGGVEVLQLRQDPGLQALFLFNVDQLQKGRFADQLVGGCVNLAHDKNPPQSMLLSCHHAEWDRRHRKEARYSFINTNLSSGLIWIICLPLPFVKRYLKRFLLIPY